MAVRAIMVTGLMLLSATNGVKAEEQKTTVSFEYNCYDTGRDWSDLSCHLRLLLTGTINNTMLEKFRLALSEVATSRRDRPSVDIDSPGGSIRSAMEIGQIVRQREMSVNVHPKFSCASACVLIFAAGVHRITHEAPWEAKTSVSGAIGIHRSYFAETPQQPVTLAEVKQQTDRTVAALRSYFEEMNVSARLADDMMVIPPQNIRWLTRSEQEGYGLVETDPVWQETQDLNEAQKYGISRTEYMKRQVLGNRICDAADAPGGCRYRVLQTGR